jgi:hypothetical protein
MREFSINVPSKAEVARQTIGFDAKTLPWDYLRHDSSRVIDQAIGALFADVQSGRFWGVLAWIDGGFNEFRPDPEEKRQAAREWAHQNFTHYELQRLLDICVDTALIVPNQTSWPGTDKGHSILHRELVQKPDSMFREAVTPEFRRRLNNGRFWEEIPNMIVGVNGHLGYHIVDDVLTQDFDDLDVSFAPEGYEIFTRNYGEQMPFDIRFLSDTGVDRYAEYFSKVNRQRDELKLTPEQLAHLVRPYATVILETQGDDYDPRFEKNGERSYIQRLQEPLVVEYATESELVRSSMAKALELHLVYGNWQHALEVLPHVPNPQDMFHRMIGLMHSPDYDLARLISKAKEMGLPLQHLIGPQSQKAFNKALEKEL